MCGIVGYVGREEAAPILLDGLARLEYRGYDSAGIAVYSARDGLQVAKAKGRLQVLSDKIHGGADVRGRIGLGHTRWATHGEPSDVNAHPQLSESGRFAVIHNGIIENYVEIKEFLQEQGVSFVSQTDTEVVAHLLDYYYKDDMMDAVVKVLHRIEGAYAFGIVCADCPDRLIAARKDSPLIIGYGQGFNFLASDVTAVIKYTREGLLSGRRRYRRADGRQGGNLRFAAAAPEQGAPHSGLGSLRGGEGRIRTLHGQGDHGTARGLPQNHLAPHPEWPGGAGRSGDRRG